MTEYRCPVCGNISDSAFKNHPYYCSLCNDRTTGPRFDNARHMPFVMPTQKMDTPSGLFRGECSCGWRGGVDSERGARMAAVQHANAKTSWERWAWEHGCGQCIVCNPLVKAREKIGRTCPTTGLGFIGPLSRLDSERANRELVMRAIKGDPTTMSGWPREWEPR